MVFHLYVKFKNKINTQNRNQTHRYRKQTDRRSPPLIGRLGEKGEGIMQYKSAVIE